MSERVRELVAEFRRLKAIKGEVLATVDAEIRSGPTVRIESASIVPVGVPFSVVFIFSGTVLGFGTDDVLVTNGTVADTYGYEGTERESFTFLVTPEATYQGVFHIAVAAGAAQDRDGNPSRKGHRHLLIVP